MLKITFLEFYSFFKAQLLIIRNISAENLGKLTMKDKILQNK